MEGGKCATRATGMEELRDRGALIRLNCPEMSQWLKGRAAHYDAVAGLPAVLHRTDR